LKIPISIGSNKPLAQFFETTSKAMARESGRIVRSDFLNLDFI
jgi:hypothetical protein